MPGRIALLTALCLSGIPVPGAAQGVLTLDQAIREAIDDNRSLAAARSTVAEADSRVREARSGRFPRVTVAESWQRGDQPVFVFSSLLSARRFAASNFAIDALNHPNSVGLFRTTVGLEHVIFDGGRQRAGVAAAQSQRDMASSAVGQAAATLAVSVTEGFGRVLAAQAAQRAAEGGTLAAGEDLARAERRRDQGLATDADVLALVVHVADLEQRTIHARGDEAVARATLNHLMGAPLDRDYRLITPPVTEGESAMDLAALLAEAESSRPEIRRAAASEQLTEATRRASRGALVPQVAAQTALEVSGTSLADRASSWIVGGELRWSFSTGGAELARMRAAAEARSRARIEHDDTRSSVQLDVVSAVRRLESARARLVVGLRSVEQARESQRIIRDRFDAGLAGVADVLRASATVLDAEAQNTTALVDAVVSRAMLDRAVGRAR